LRQRFKGSLQVLALTQRQRVQGRQFTLSLKWSQAVAVVVASRTAAVILLDHQVVTPLSDLSRALQVVVPQAPLPALEGSVEVVP
jgi:hypothetical protein